MKMANWTQKKQTQKNSFKPEHNISSALKARTTENCGKSFFQVTKFCFLSSFTEPYAQSLPRPKECYTVPLSIANLSHLFQRKFKLLKRVKEHSRIKNCHAKS